MHIRVVGLNVEQLAARHTGGQQIGSHAVFGMNHAPVRGDLVVAIAIHIIRPRKLLIRPTHAGGPNLGRPHIIHQRLRKPPVGWARKRVEIVHFNIACSGKPRLAVKDHHFVAADSIEITHHHATDDTCICRSNRALEYAQAIIDIEITIHAARNDADPSVGVFANIGAVQSPARRPDLPLVQ